MNNRLLTVLIIFPIWLTLVLVFRRHRQWLFYYLIAAFGFTLQAVLIAEYFGWDQLLVNLASYHVSLIGKYLFNLKIDLLSNGRFQLSPLGGGGSSILKLGIECSAILESVILIALLAFYPLFNLGQKILRILFGLVMTYVINLARLLIIVLMAYKLGPDYIFMAHAVVARFFFFACELLLYWYLITKPTVKSVGDSIKNGLKLEETVKLGKSLQLKHAVTQVVIISIVVLSSIISLFVSKEWHKSFAGIKPVERPLIYQDKTTITPISQPSLNQKLTFSLRGGEKKLLTFKIAKGGEIIIQTLEGKQDIAARLILNGKDLKFLIMPSSQFNQPEPLFTAQVKSGDNLELRIQNLSQELSDYSFRIASQNEEKDQICPRLASEDQPISSPSQSSQVQPSVAGVTSEKLNQVIPLILAGGQKTQLRFDISGEQTLNIAVPEGEKVLAARLILNGQERDFITAAPWRYTKQDSIFDPISVKAGDTLEIRFQNLADVPSNYLIKIYPLKEKNVQ